MKIEIEKNKFYIDEKLNTLFVEDLGTDIVGARIANDKGKLMFGNQKSIYKKIYKQFLYQEIEVNVDLKEYETFEYCTQGNNFYIRNA